MKLVFVTSRAWPAVGGMESYLRTLAQELAREHEVTILAQAIDSDPRGRLGESLGMPAPFVPFADGDVRVEHLPLPTARRALLTPLATQVVPGLRRYAYGRARIAASELFARVVAPVIAARAAGADVVHMWGTSLLAAAAVRAAGLLRVPCIVTPFAHEGQWGDDVAAARTYRAADAVTALLEVEARLYERLGVAVERVVVVPVCSGGVAAGGGDALRARRGIDGPLVLFLGARRPYKGLDLVLSAAPSLPHATFAVVGPGPPVEAEGRIIDAGEVDEAERAAWLDAADVLCLPSAAEIFPVSFLEAWSVGTPVLASDIPTLRELVERAGGGWVAPRRPTDVGASLAAALADPAALQARGAAGREFWRGHATPGAVAAAYERVYAQVDAREASRCAA